MEREAGLRGKGVNGVKKGVWVLSTTVGFSSLFSKILQTNADNPLTAVVYKLLGKNNR
jgi:hypothetical protein